MVHVYEGKDARVTFRDGGRTGEKEEIVVLLRDVSLALEEVVPEPLVIRDGGQIAHLRRGDEQGMKCALSWKLGSTALYQDVAKFLTGVSTSSQIKNLCESPNDYNHTSWVKSNLVLPMPLNGIAPDDISTAQRLTPTVPPGVGSLYTQTAFIPQVGEWIYADFWAKAAVPHNAQAGVAMTAHGAPPLPEQLIIVPLQTYWQKFTNGIQNQSTYSTDETLTFSLLTDVAVPPDGKTVDMWGVEIRRDVPGMLSTWDMYVDFYYKGAIERTIIVEHVAYQTVGFSEGDDATSYALYFTTLSTGPTEVEY